MREAVLAAEGDRGDPGALLYIHRKHHVGRMPLPGTGTGTGTDTGTGEALAPFLARVRLAEEAALQETWVTSRRLEGGLVERKTHRHRPARTFE
jgi:hypothetical protein